MERACFGRSRIYRGREPKAVHGVIRIFAAVMFLLLTLLGADVSAQTDCSATSATGVTEAECQALVGFYNQTNGANWDTKTNWNTAQLINTWYGVEVLNGQVEKLKLPGNGLSGTTPATLENLTSLEILQLQDNMLTGEIPDLSPLISLRELSLAGNQLDGSIPASLGDLTSLRGLYLQDNMLTGSIPASLGDLTSLQFLQLRGNMLTGEIPDLSLLTSLLRLDLGNNRLDGTIPASLGDLTSLHVLFLWGNELTGEIPDLRPLTSLRQLSLARNRLDGSIPASLGEITSLLFLYLNNNMLTGEIPDLRPLTSLLQLDLGNNRLDGTIPDSLGDLTNLQFLYLDENMFTGSIPASLGDLTSLQRLYLNDNMLTGSIPASLGDLTSLQRLYLNDNMLTGSIPASLGDLTSLQRLNISNNRQLTGELPLRLMDLPLETLDIRCTGVSVPADTDFQTWLSGINFQRVCPPPPRPRPPPPPPPPPQVTGVMVIEGVEQLSVLWDSVSGADGYKVQWKSGLQQFDDPDDPSREHITSDNTASYTISNLAPGTEYTVRVIATKSGGAADGTPSPEMTGIPGAPPPPQVTGVMVTQGVEQLSVLWDSVSGADGYKVQWKSGLQQFDDPDDPSREHITSDNTASYTISNLAPGTEYTVRVIATKAYADDGTPSPEMTGIPGAPPPPQVTEVMVTQGVEQLSVLWDSVSGADGYKVQWKSGSDKFDSSRQHVVTGGDTTKYTISNLAPGTEYTVRVIATKAYADDGTPSPEMTGIPSGRGGCTIASNGVKGNTSNSVLLNLLLVVFVLVSVVFPEKGSRQSPCVLQEIP